MRHTKVHGIKVTKWGDSYDQTLRLIQGETVRLRPFDLSISPGNLVPITGDHRDGASKTPDFVRLRPSNRSYMQGKAIRVWVIRASISVGGGIKPTEH